MIGKVILAGSNKCPICGKEFKPTPPLRPNTEDREFYGGRVKFFKQVQCNCEAEYDLCIEKRYDSLKEDETLSVINMIVLKEGTPLDELWKKREEEAKAAAEIKAMDIIHEAIQNNGKIPSVAEREEIKKQTVLATVLDKDEKMQTLMQLTTKELQTMCKRRKLHITKKYSKKQLAETLIAYDPTVVIANPED